MAGRRGRERTSQMLFSKYKTKISAEKGEEKPGGTKLDMRALKWTKRKAGGIVNQSTNHNTRTPEL